MPSKKTDVDRVAAMNKRFEELSGYLSRLEAAFDELHGTVLRQVKIAQYIRPHHDYPVMSTLDAGFPSFHDPGIYQDGAPRHYVSTVRPRGLLGLFSGSPLPDLAFPEGAALAEFLRTHDIGKRLNLLQHVYDGKASDWTVDNLVGDAVSDTCIYTG